LSPILIINQLGERGDLARFLICLWRNPCRW